MVTFLSTIHVELLTGWWNWRKYDTFTFFWAWLSATAPVLAMG